MERGERERDHWDDDLQFQNLSEPTWIPRQKVQEDSSWGGAPKQTAGSDWPAGEREGRRGPGLECGLGGSYWSAVGRKAGAASVEGVGPQDGHIHAVHVVEL